MPCASNVLSDLLNACVGQRYPAEEDELAHTSVLFLQDNPRRPQKRVCSHVDSFAVCLRSNYPFSLKSLSPEMGSALSPW